MERKVRVDIVVPTYNEEKELETNIIKLHSFSVKNLNNYLWRIIIADNASTDQSLKIASELSKKLNNIRFLHLNKKGRGRAIKKSWSSSDASIYTYMDVDLSTDLNNFIPLIGAIEDGYDIAIGSRLLASSNVANRPLKREILSRGYNILIKLIFQITFSDAQCGFKAVSRNVVNELLPKISDNAWFFDSELLIVGEKKGFKIKEIPVVWIDNPGSTVRVLKTVFGDLAGLWRLFWQKPWSK